MKHGIAAMLILIFQNTVLAQNIFCPKNGDEVLILRDHNRTYEYVFWELGRKQRIQGEFEIDQQGHVRFDANPLKLWGPANLDRDREYIDFYWRRSQFAPPARIHFHFQYCRWPAR